MKKWLVTLITILSFSSFADEVANITADELKSSATAEWLILDVRTEEEYEQGHVPKAMNIAHDELDGKISAIAQYKDKPVVVYCRSGRRAGMAADILLEHGFTQVKHLEGDMVGWKANGHTIEK